MPQPQRVFITGASGFIGRALGERYRSLGSEIAGVDQHDDPERGVVAGNIAEPGAWQAQAEGADLVIHTAAVVSNAVDADMTWRVNVLGTRNAVDAARGSGRFVHFSSIRAFSDRHYPDGADERWPVRSDGNPYVDTKVASEQVVLQAHAAGEIVATIVRPGDVYGPGSKPWITLPLKAIKEGKFALPARGEGIFTPVYVDDLVDGVVLAAGSPNGAGQVFTLTDGSAVTTREFFGHLFRMLDKDGPKTVPTGVAVAMTAVQAALARVRGRDTESNPTTVRYLARTGGYSIAHARELLDYEPKVDLAEGMRRTEEWLRGEGLL